MLHHAPPGTKLWSTGTGMQSEDGARNAQMIRVMTLLEGLHLHLDTRSSDVVIGTLIGQELVLLN